MVKKSQIKNRDQKKQYLKELSSGMANSNTLCLTSAIKYKSISIQSFEQVVALNVFSNFLNLPVDIVDLVGFILKKNIIICKYQQLFGSARYSKHYRCAGCNRSILAEDVAQFQLEQCYRCGSPVQTAREQNAPDKGSDFSYKYEVHPVIELDTDCNPVDINRCAFLVWHLIVHGLYYVLSQNRHLLDIDYTFLEAIAEAAPQKDLTKYLIEHLVNDLHLFSGTFNLSQSGQSSIVNSAIDSVFTRIAPHLKTLLEAKKHKELQEQILSEIKRVLDDLDVRRITADCFRSELQVRRLLDSGYERKNAGFDFKLKWMNRMLTVEETSMIQGYARQNKRLIRDPVQPSLTTFQNTMFLSSTNEKIAQEIVFYRDLLQQKFKDIFTGVLAMNVFMVLGFNGLVERDWFQGKAVSDVLPHSADEHREEGGDRDFDQSRLYADLTSFNRRKSKSKKLKFFIARSDQEIYRRFKELSPHFAIVLAEFKRSLKALLELPQKSQRYLLGEEFPRFRKHFKSSWEDIRRNKIRLFDLLNESESSEFSLMHSALRGLVATQNKLVRRIRELRSPGPSGCASGFPSETRSLFQISGDRLFGFEIDSVEKVILENSAPDARFQQEKTIEFDFASINEHFFREFVPKFPELEVIPANRFNFINSVSRSTNDNLSVIAAKFGCETTRHFLTAPVGGRTAHSSQDIADFEALKTVILRVNASSEFTRDTRIKEVLRQAGGEHALPLSRSLARFKELPLRNLYALYCHLEVKLESVMLTEFELKKERQPFIKDQELRKNPDNESEHIHFDALWERLKAKRIRCNTEHKITKPLGELMYVSLVRFCSRYYRIQKRETASLVDRLKHAPRVRSEWFDWGSHWQEFMQYLHFHYFDIDACTQLLKLVRKKMSE